MITARRRVTGVRYCDTKSCTSRPRSPMSPTTMTSAVVNRVIMPSSTLLPTPLPAKSPRRCPRPTVSKPLIVRTPTSSGSRIGRRSRGFIGRGESLMRSSQRSGPPPSSGSPAPSITRPSSPGPAQASNTLWLGITRAPGFTPPSSSVATSSNDSPEKPTTSVSAALPSPSTTRHRLPTGASHPVASRVMPANRRSTPCATNPRERCGAVRSAENRAQSLVPSPAGSGTCFTRVPLARHRRQASQR